MKDLSYKELMEAPTIIQYLYATAISKIPIGGPIIEQAMAEYPQYFPEEIESRRKWDAVPDYVKRLYFATIAKMMNEYESQLPHHGKGLLFFIINKTAFNEQLLAREAQRNVKIIEARKIHKQYLASYGIKFNENLFL